MEDGEQRMHTGGQGDLLGFAPREQLLVAGAQRRVVAHAHQRGHGEGGAHLPPAAPDGARAAPGATCGTGV